MRNSKVVTLEEAIKRSGLQNGMTSVSTIISGVETKW